MLRSAEKYCVIKFFYGRFLMAELKCCGEKYMASFINRLGDVHKLRSVRIFGNLYGFAIQEGF
jgi:hypothetical protein